MTDNYRRDWFNIAGYYNKQPIRETPHRRSPSSAIETIDHFSKPRILRRYANPYGYANDGYPKLGDYETIEFWCFIRSIWADKRDGVFDVYDQKGVVTEGRFALYYNPYNVNHPKEGIHLHLSNPRSELTKDYSGFADIIEFDGLLWKVIKHNIYDTAYDDGNEYIGKATITMHTENIVNNEKIELDNSNCNNTYKIK